MLQDITKAKLITGADTKDIYSGEELAHRNALVKYFREIPQNFISISKDPKKHDIIRDHLKIFYKTKPADDEVSIVVDRILNLAQFLTLGREAVENKSEQIYFKKNHWQSANRCTLCGKEFATYEEVSLDHIIPLSLGGPERPENWQLTCKLCNTQKDGYWGCSDISRIETFRKVDGQYFGRSEDEILLELKKPHNPTRFWIFERDRYCCSICQIPAKEQKMIIAGRDVGFLATIDNLATFCTKCAKENRKNIICD